MQKPNIRRLIAGRDVEPETTERCFAFGKKYLGFRLLGAARRETIVHALFEHQAGIRYLFSYPDNGHQISTIERLLMSELRQIQN